MKRNILHIISLSITLIFSFLHADKGTGKYIEFSNHEVFIPQKLGDLKLYKDAHGFHVEKNDTVYDVQNCFCDPVLRKMTNKQLMSFLGRDQLKVIEITPNCLQQINQEDIVEITGDERDLILSQLSNDCGYIAVTQMSDGQYRLEAKMRLLGGTWRDNATIFAIHFVGILFVASCGALVGTTAALLDDWPIALTAKLTGLATGSIACVASITMLNSEKHKSTIKND